MQWIKRYYEYEHSKLFKFNKVTIIYGPRRSGKTSLVNKLLEKYKNKKILEITGEDFDTKALLESQKLSLLNTYFSGYEIIFIDEAQYVNNIGMVLKLMIDNIKNLIIIVTGSSSFDISNKLSEPLTGRYVAKTIFPVSCLELKLQFESFYILNNLENFLIFGMYPEILTAENANEKKEYLINLRNSYLFKDILQYESIKNASKLFDLLRLLAFQIGKEVSLNELSNSLGIAKKTVERYLDLLEKCFVIKKIKGFSRNLRNEVTKTSRYYFYDNGILNSLTNNFNQLKLRNDYGQLWENFIVMEMIKRQHYLNLFSNNYFWRTYQKQEIDLIEEREGKLFAYEIKWSSKKRKIPKLWRETYKNSEFNFITKENFLEYICKI